MLGFFLPRDIRTRALEEAGTLEYVTRPPFAGLTITSLSGESAVVALQDSKFEIINRARGQVCAIPCQGSLLVEVVSAAEHWKDIRSTYGWIALCAEGPALVCRAKDKLGSDVPSLVSLCSGRELGNLIGTEAEFGIGRWRLHRVSAKDGETTVICDNSHPTRAPE